MTAVLLSFSAFQQRRHLTCSYDSLYLKQKWPAVATVIPREVAHHSYSTLPSLFSARLVEFAAVALILNESEMVHQYDTRQIRIPECLQAHLPKIISIAANFRTHPWFLSLKESMAFVFRIVNSLVSQWATLSQTDHCLELTSGFCVLLFSVLCSE